MIHIYHGDGKGKTTAACGLAVRAAGRGLRVLFAQFFKDGSSGEIGVLSAIPHVETRHPPLHLGRWAGLSGGERERIAVSYRAYFEKIVSDAEKYDLIVLDEALSAFNHGCFPRDALLPFLRAQGGVREIVLTGRDPAEELLEAGDYVTEMRKEKHPFDRGVGAREGVEY